MKLPPPAIETPRTSWQEGTLQPGTRMVAEETAIAFVYHGATEAVMMATPQDLEDFARGFSLTEGIIAHPSELVALEVVPSAHGIELRMELADTARDAASRRRRQRAGPAGCGLCGIESLDQAMRPVPPATTAVSFRAQDVTRALRLLQQAQGLNHQTRAVHAAAFYRPADDAILVREDVGRHNALDKVAGAIAGSHRDGFVVMTSRVSVELVQKAAMMGVGMLAAISAPTALALRVAEAAGICVIGVARDDGMEIFSHPERVLP